MANNTVNMTLRLPPELAAYLNVVSHKTGKSKHQVILDTLTQQYRSNGSTSPSNNPKAIGEVGKADPILSMLKSLSDRLDKLEDTKDTRGNNNDDDNQQATGLTEFYEGQEITGQHSKLYQLLRRNLTAKQKITPQVKGWKRKPTIFALFKGLGLVCIITHSRGGKDKYKVIYKFDPSEEVYVSPEGHFLNDLLEWLEAKDNSHDDHANTLDNANSVRLPEAPCRADKDSDKASVRARPYQLEAVGVQLSLDELKQHLETMGSTPSESLINIPSKLLDEAEVTELLDTDWLLYWLPTDYSDHHTWVLSKKLNYGI